MSGLSRRDLFKAGAAVAAAGAMARPEAGRSAAEADAKSPAKFQLGMVTYNTAANWDLPTLLQVSRRTGVAAVECRTTHKHGVEPGLTAGQRRDVKKQFEDSGVVFWGAGSVCEFHDPDRSVVEKNVEECKRFVDLVADLGGTGVKVRPNGLPAGVPVEKTLEQIGKALVECGKAGADAGVEIWVEVHGRGTSDPRHMKTIMEACGHESVGVCWNSNVGSDFIDGGIDVSFEMLRPWLMSVHINSLYLDHAGRYPYRRLFELLAQAGYDRYTMNESGWLPPDVRSGEEMLHYYNALWHELLPKA